MSLYVVKRDLPGITPEALQSAGVRAKTCCAEMTGEGQAVRWCAASTSPKPRKLTATSRRPARPPWKKRSSAPASPSPKSPKCLR